MEYELIVPINDHAHRTIVGHIRRLLGIGMGLHESEEPQLSLEQPNGIFAIMYYIQKTVGIFVYGDIHDALWKVSDEDYARLRMDATMTRLNLFYDTLDEMNELCITANKQASAS